MLCFGTSQAIFGEGTRLTVLETGVNITQPVVKIVNETSCKDKVTLVCLAEDFYPDHVSIKWTLGSREITEDVATDPYATQSDTTRKFRISSRLKVPKKEFTPKIMFTCTVTFINEKEENITESAHITGTGEAGYEPEDYLKSSQTISLAYGVFIAKSALYGLVILVFVCRRGSSGKRIN
ncbi:T cell receptor beta chain MC.7.G5-like isoform X1 [Onychostoma macrolepis]|uniref:T cell receptor beta chain MC.7.G5-like isoform X1 n=1 Tax=Onychostoma macrolepis TaxID=369639 RepID=UPI00272A3571|nr:T cell receptor beta chain MC.7.G5-like isoform X1 [Onychostoma macrolepis]